jgi:XTP/dITP diphosphohydrolase
MRTIYFITGNKGKLEEAKNKLSEVNIKVVQKNIGYPEIQADSLEDVASFGAKYIQKKINSSFILEDAGLFIESLNGFPGVYSAYVFYSIGCTGILKLLEEVDTDKRKACFRSVLTYVELNKKPRFFIGECHGKISTIKTGIQGFGYDPIFIPNGKTKTFAQMSINEKNDVSHRGKALKKLLDIIKHI